MWIKLVFEKIRTKHSEIAKNHAIRAAVRLRHAGSRRPLMALFSRVVIRSLQGDEPRRPFNVRSTVSIAPKPRLNQHKNA